MRSEIQTLEHDIFQLIEATYAAILLRQYGLARQNIVAIEELNKDYKQITQVDYVSPERVLNMQERLWEKQNT